MAFLYGWQRKLALLPLSLFVLGWLVYSAGFIWMLVKWDQDSHNSTSTVTSMSRHDPLTYPYYVILLGGPLVFLLGLLHAILPSTASSIIGVASAAVSSVFFASNGWAIYHGALHLRFVLKLNFSVDAKIALMFSGTLFAAFCWCLVMMLSVSYNYKKSTPNSYEFFNRDEFFNHCQESSRNRNIPFTPGVARILSVPFIILSVIGWCVFVVGVYKLPDLESNAYDTSQSLFYFSFYGSMVTGPLLYLAALLHAGCSGGANTVMGVFTSVLHTLYIVFMGFVVTEFGRYIYFSCQESTLSLNCSLLHSSIDVNIIYTFAGSVGSLFFWTFVLALWPFYRSHPSSSVDVSDNVAAINATSPMTYGTMQMKESLTYSDYLAQHQRQSLLISESS